MALKTTYGKLDAEDLARHQLAEAQLEAMRVMPAAYGRTEVEHAFQAQYRRWGEFADKYGIPTGSQWGVDLGNGEIFERED